MAFTAKFTHISTLPIHLTTAQAVRFIKIIVEGWWFQLSVS